MEKLDTVVTGLGACIMGLCQSCPYGGDDHCKDRLMRDALGVIKALNEDQSGDLIRLSDLMKFPIRIDHYDTENGNEHFVYGVECVLEYAEYLPRVEVEPVVHAYWEFDDFSSPNLKCSACGGMASMDCCGDYHSERTERCPHCGAHMDEEVIK